MQDMMPWNDKTGAHTTRLVLVKSFLKSGRSLGRKETRALGEIMAFLSKYKFLSADLFFFDYSLSSRNFLLLQLIGSKAPRHTFSLQA